jgi:hypothetical protein
MTESEDEKLQLSTDEVVWRDVGDELVVLELSTSTYLTLNGTAKQIWEGLAGGATRGALVESLVDRYQISADQARADVDSFVAELSSRGLLALGD